jgi:biotin synthase
MIIGMGEEYTDIIDVAKRLRALKAESIPINILVPIEGNVLSTDSSRVEGHALSSVEGLTPDFILRALCLFRFLNPSSEIRVAAGRELHLRSMEVMALYPANSLFLQGYLNAKGSSNASTLRMIKDAGFSIKSEADLDELIVGGNSKVVLKTLKELRPAIHKG